MRTTIAIALLLGASVEAVLLEKKHAHKDSAEIALKKKELAILEKDVVALRQDYQTLHDEELAVHALARPFAEGMGDGEKVGETLHMNDQDVITIPPNGRNGAERFTVNVPQKHRQPALARPFADGMGDGEKVDETLRIKDCCKEKEDNGKKSVF